MAKRDSGQGRKVEALVAVADDSLDQDGHTLVIVEQTHTLSIGDGVGADHTGIDGSNGTHQRRQVFVQRALVGQEKGIVLAGKGEPKVVLEQA